MVTSKEDRILFLGLVYYYFERHQEKQEEKRNGSTSIKNLNQGKLETSFARITLLGTFTIQSRIFHKQEAEREPFVKGGYVLCFFFKPLHLVMYKVAPCTCVLKLNI